jgi:diaminopimelate decarboxylase
MNASTALAGFAAVFGFAAAILSLKAARTSIKPNWFFEPGRAHLAHMGLTASTVEAFKASERLNSRVAFLTLIAGAISAISCVFGVCGW